MLVDENRTRRLCNTNHFSKPLLAPVQIVLQLQPIPVTVVAFFEIEGRVSKGYINRIVRNPLE